MSAAISCWRMSLFQRAYSWLLIIIAWTSTCWQSHSSHHRRSWSPASATGLSMVWAPASRCFGSPGSACLEESNVWIWDSWGGRSLCGQTILLFWVDSNPCIRSKADCCIYNSKSEMHLIWSGEQIEQVCRNFEDLGIDQICKDLLLSLGPFKCNLCHRKLGRQESFWNGKIGKEGKILERKMSLT